MNIIHVVKTLPRLVDDALAARLRVMPAVVLTGARQTGKSTLVEKLVPGDRRYRSLDDFDVRDAARRDPEALLGGDDPLTLDEVQREPGLLTAVKRAIDRDRRPGRFLLTGSTNLLLMRQVSESLAGRASYLTLWPMTRREQLGLARAGRWDELLATPEAISGATCSRTGMTLRKTGKRSRCAGGFPRRRWNSRRRPTAPSGSTATCAPISNATCRTSPRSARCPTSAA